VQELSALMKSEPDLSMDIDLSAPGDQAMRIDHGRLGKQLEQARSDVIKLKHKTGMLTIGYQARDLMAESERNTQAAFNAIDVDANGYLDRDEIVDHQRFERYLFDGMDTNDDDRVFADEMLAYVRAYTEPATMTCQATLLDAGNGFFQILDDNGDGRISIRELRQCESLLLAQSDEQQQINPSRMTKSYRIVFQRGGVSLFGRVSRPQAETPEALLRAPSGPIWFQRMDRNSDGDLVWDEFLGPREAFHQLDRDGDNLVSTQEASEYEKRQTTDSQ
jgi:Ca2+-binding EF-hand superfamily protein